MSEEQAQVTKSKNEGRVAAGKRLAKWNARNKENLLKNKDQVSSSSESGTSASAGQEPASTSASAISTQALYGGVVIAVGIAMFFLWKRQTPATTSPTVGTNRQHNTTITQRRAAALPYPEIDLAMF